MNVPVLLSKYIEDTGNFNFFVNTKKLLTFERSWPLVFLKYVFIRFRAENERSSQGKDTLLILRVRDWERYQNLEEF